MLCNCRAGKLSISARAKSCVLTSPIAPRPKKARRIPSAPTRRSLEFVPCNNSSNRKEIEAGRALAAKSQNRFARLQLSLVTARYQLAMNQTELSRQELRNVVREAHSHGFIGIELEAQLLNAQLTMKDGHVAFAKEQLLSLEKDARTKGFGLIAQKAAAARS